MSGESKLITFDEQSGAWTDGTHYVAGTNIRAYSRDLGLRRDNRGRLSKEEIATYFEDKYGVIANVK